MNKKNETILSASGICKSYPMGREQLTVLRGVDLSVRRGEFLAIMGASGSGKSTLLHIMGLLDRPDKGQVRFDGDDIFVQSRGWQDRIRNREMGFVFQFYHLLPELNVVENVMLPLMVATPLWHWVGRRKKLRQRALEVLAEVGLKDKAAQRPNTLSGGERQRTAIARALVQKPRLLLADEPTGNLDWRAGKVILEVLDRLNRQGQTVVMVTHDAAVADLADRKVFLRDGRIEKPKKD